jgi:hypothetical protein
VVLLDRRDFVGSLGAIILGSKLMHNSGQTQQPLLQYPLISTPDLDTTLNPEMAAKARKLAEYIITRPNQPGLLSYNSNPTGPRADRQIVEAVMVVDGQRYTVWVSNRDENRLSPFRDVMFFWVRPNGTQGQEDLTTFSDWGLDGRCDFGIIPAKHSPTGQEIIFEDGVILPIRRGLQHREGFQGLYEQTLDKLIAFYEMAPRSR